jgi:hypothetical protein
MDLYTGSHERLHSPPYPSALARAGEVAQAVLPLAEIGSGALCVIWLRSGREEDSLAQ